MRKYGVGKAKLAAEEVYDRSKQDAVFGADVKWVDWVRGPNVTDADWKELQNTGKGGWLVLQTGCIYPVVYSDNDELSSIRRALGQPANPIITPPGFPAGLQSSLRCHDHNCVNGFHAILEPQWCNLRRNYCRGNIVRADGVIVHDCGMTPECLRPYMNTDKRYDNQPGIVVSPRYQGPFTRALLDQVDLAGHFPLFNGLYDPAIEFAKEWKRLRTKREKDRSAKRLKGNE